MKCTLLYQPEPQEIEVEISCEEVFASLRSRDPGECLFQCIEAIKAAYVVLSRVPDDLIGQMKEAQRKTIAEALQKEVARY